MPVRRSATVRIAPRLVVGLVVALGAATACSSAKGTSSAAGATPFCAAMKAVPASVTAGVTDAASAKVAYKKLTDAYASLAADAPAELKSDVALLAGLSKRSYDLLVKYDFDVTKAATDPGFAAFQADSTAPAVKTASQHMDDYATTTCGIDLATLTPTTTTG